MYKVGQGVLGKITFKDGVEPSYNRTYLIIKVNGTDISVLNVSSLKGKERKLAFPSNYKIDNYNPPFDFPSFAKLDSLTTVSESFINSNCRLLRGGALLSSTDINNILKKLT